jgi:hypothetical protein
MFKSVSFLFQGTFLPFRVHIVVVRRFEFMCGGCCGSDEEENQVAEAAKMVACKYCATLFVEMATFCPHCGARRTA